jgi:hypothetical protein
MVDLSWGIWFLFAVASFPRFIITKGITRYGSQILIDEYGSFFLQMQDQELPQKKKQTTVDLEMSNMFCRSPKIWPVGNLHTCAKKTVKNTLKSPL